MKTKTRVYLKSARLDSISYDGLKTVVRAVLATGAGEQAAVF